MTDRLLILAPRGRDAEVAADLFARHAIAAEVCPDMSTVLTAIDAGAGAVLLTEEVLADADADRLADWIAAQPTWSDLPFIVLANGHRGPRSAVALRRLQALGNIVLLERPLHAEAMLSAARSAFKARSRQYQVRDSVAELRESERDLRFTLNAGRLGAWALDLLSGELTTSATCRANFGRDPARPFSYAELADAIHPDDRQRMVLAVAESVTTGADYDIEYRIITPESEVRWVLIRAQPTYGAGGAPLKMTGVSIDITDRKREEARRAVLVELNDAIRDSKNADDLAYCAAEMLGRALGVSRAGYGTIDTRNETIVIERDWNAPGVTSIAGTLKFRDYGTYIDDLKRGETVCVVDADSDPRTLDTSAALKSISARSFINMPVTEQGDFVALIFANHAERRSWTEPEVALLRDVAERTRTAVERLRAEAELRESEARYRELFEAIDAGFAIIETKFDDSGRPLDLRFLEVNPAFQRQPGLAGAEGRWASEAAPMLQRHWQEACGRVALSGTPARWENDFFGRWYDVHAFRTGEPGEHRVGVLFNDISDRRRAELALLDLNETLEIQVAERTAERDRMWDTSPDLMLVSGFDEVVQRVNPAWTTLLGYTPDQLVGRHVNDFVLRDDHAETVKSHALAAAGERPATVNRYRHHDGSVRWISWVAAPAGEMIYATGRDVTAERIRAEILAQRTAERDMLATIVETTDTLIQALDHDFRWLAVNDANASAYERMYGRRPRLGDSLLDMLAYHPEQRATARAVWARALAGESFSEVSEWSDGQLERRFFELRFECLRGAGGASIGAFMTGRDVTDRVLEQRRLSEVEEALRQSQKMEAMGSLTGGVAHDFNNLLTPIVGSLDMLQRKGLGGEREQRLIAGAIQSADRAKTLVQRLLAFARRQPLQSSAVDLTLLVRNMAGLIASTTGPQIKVVVDAPAGLPPAKADPNQLEMAILNLAVNARDAMPEGGTLRIAVDVETVRPPHRADVAPGQYLRVSVADTGIGMDEVTIKRAIEPFFSTKGVGKGTGLGLSMVHGLASQLSGALTISSTPGVGTNIELWLPQSASPVVSTEAATDAAPLVRGSGTALLVDDEDLVRLSTADMLAELGYAVVEAASAEEALTLVARGLQPDLLVTDHLMPGMTGTELAHTLRSTRPKTKVLVVSGYAETDGIAPDLPRLTKPFRNSDLAESLAGLN